MKRIQSVWYIMITDGERAKLSDYEIFQDISDEDKEKIPRIIS